jgi:hypothetical protein
MKQLVLVTAVAVSVAGCLYCFLAYSSLRSEFRALGLR